MNKAYEILKNNSKLTEEERQALLDLIEDRVESGAITDTYNPILDSDSYKPSHYLQYREGSESTFYYLESRGSEREYKETVFFGLQYILRKYFSKCITMAQVEYAKEMIESHGEPFNEEGWKHIVTEHGGYFPLRIRAVPEGTVVPTHQALVTTETNCKDCEWLGSYVETALMRLWYPITVATQSYYLRKLIYKYLVETADNPDEEIKFKLHDFGGRGVSSYESAGIGGLAHLISFLGTDTMPALQVAREYYNTKMAGFSIPAAEHSTISSWGREGEIEAYRNMLAKYGGKYPLIAVVSDTWDIFNACENIWGGVLRQEVIDSGSMIVVRPDSGDPKTVVMRCLNILADKFGYTINSKGYKVLNNVRIIQGDGVNPNSIAEILEAMKAENFSVTNIAFGMGGALLQKVNRDTLKFAYKCSSTTIEGEEQDVYKDPITDTGKRSKRGRLDLILAKGFKDRSVSNENYETVRLENGEISKSNSVMITYFENGQIFVNDSMEDVRRRALTL